jgi:hypothetical protein
MEADAHPIEHLLALLWISFEAAATLIVALIALVLTISGWRPEGFPQKSPEINEAVCLQKTEGKDPAITTPAPVPQEGHLRVLEGIGPVIALEPAPATPAPQRRAAKRAPATTPQPQSPAASSPAPRRRRSPAAV